MNIQPWSCNYDPEPTGIGPVSTVWVRGMRAPFIGSIGPISNWSSVWGCVDSRG